jgi:hypothetical protein
MMLGKFEKALKSGQRSDMRAVHAELMRSCLTIAEWVKPVADPETRQARAAEIQAMVAIAAELRLSTRGFE